MNKRVWSELEQYHANGRLLGIKVGLSLYKEDNKKIKKIEDKKYKEENVE